MDIRKTDNGITLTGVTKYRDSTAAITLSWVKMGNGIAYVITYKQQPVFFNSLAEALADLNNALLNSEMNQLIQCLN